ncbi:ADP compounds hydrolase NudE [Larsenimonas rhizosphaerae]|uniref:ADP compounds hydrolase NudE n=1 Tax=Larsenimonas rhizosphaerae TaxID=2944682 RepID=A0AA41ZGE2_9GAMM|nr:ADP compounds hydrolase NudE [Larsenimonas rhizosphaerae]MCM2131887.1 ADP compounds hydrolase NudE [Larsenimonas rhizosphaerae]MCX2524807.1 ADP compounds hydrolase NudE [Larsenimonas rhizosphaerae]
MPKKKPCVDAVYPVAESRLFRIEALDLTFSNGEQRCFERLSTSGTGNGAVMIVAMPDDEHVLLIREYAAGIEDYTLTLPKGIIDNGEDVLTAANRELKEECGYGARILEPLTELSLAPNYMSYRIQVVIAQDLYEETLPGDEPEPMETVRWRWDELGALLAREDMHEGRAIAALFMAREYLKTRENNDARWW